MKLEQGTYFVVTKPYLAGNLYKEGSTGVVVSIDLTPEDDRPDRKGVFNAIIDGANPEDIATLYGMEIEILPKVHNHAPD